MTKYTVLLNSIEKIKDFVNTTHICETGQYDSRCRWENH